MSNTNPMKNEYGQPSFFESEIPNTAPEKAKFHVIGVPLEATVSYSGGTAAGPLAILEASSQLELWNGEEEFALNYPIHTPPMIDCNQDVASVFRDTAYAVSAALRVNAIPFLLGGEHTVTYGALLGIRDFYGEEEPIGILHFDAHADLRFSYEGSEWSHACVMRRAYERHFKLFQIGTRAYCKEEHDFRVAHAIPHLNGADLSSENIANLELPPDFPQKVYVSFDIDGLDSSVIPATGTPVPGGLMWRDALYLLKKLTSGRKVVGMDVVELAPMPNFHASNFAAAALVYHMMKCAIRK